MMMAISPSDEIRATLSMYQVCEQYGFEPNRAGYIACPFHTEKTPSLKIYKDPGRGFHCFGCGKGGSVIDFVMELFRLDFRAAVVRLDHDFGLGLLGEVPDRRELDALRAQRRREKAELNAYRRQYMENVELFRRLWFARRDLAPNSPDEPLHPLFVQSLARLEYLEYWFEENPWR